MVTSAKLEPGCVLCGALPFKRINYMGFCQYCLEGEQIEEIITVASRKAYLMLSYGPDLHVDCSARIIDNFVSLNLSCSNEAQLNQLKLHVYFLATYEELLSNQIRELPREIMLDFERKEARDKTRQQLMAYEGQKFERLSLKEQVRELSQLQLATQRLISQRAKRK